MYSASIATAMAPNSSPYRPDLFKVSNPSPLCVNYVRRFNRPARNLTVSNCLNLRPQELRNSVSSPISRSGVVSLRLQRLASEFRSLPEPIDRVKRLLNYASVLTQLTDSVRSPDNRVPGCAAQVWLEVEIDELGRTRFGADSDSEITKGFCSCLIYLLDGASSDEVLMVKAEDLTDMNVGLPVRSRDRTRSLMAERENFALSSLVISHDDVLAKDCTATLSSHIKDSNSLASTIIVDKV
ncbi:hypothetical protein V2J09_015471 [Rumex salicifolius]